MTFGETALLVGPNNAGKSTLISALRAGSMMIRQGRRQRPPTPGRDAGIPRNSYPMFRSSATFSEENLRHEFRLERDTRIEIGLSSRARLIAVWPAMDGEDEFGEPIGPPAHFYFVDRNGDPFRSLQSLREATPSIGVVPVLSPLEQQEKVLSEDYVREHLSSRLASRHLRNQLLHLEGGASSTHRDAYVEFLDFVATWLPEMPLGRPQLSGAAADGRTVDIYYREGRTPKELVWAGDGVQVFIQLLLHLFRVRQTDVVILDEPEVYLHADLQRRLMRYLTTRPGQTILASHSAEVVAEAPLEATILVDRNRRKAVRAADPVVLSKLTDTIGTSFNLRLAKVLRSRVAVFVEGEDLGILRRFAATLGLQSLVTEANVAVVKLGGASNRRRLESFGWLRAELLEKTVEGYVILDRDYHSEDTVASWQSMLRETGLHVHVWRRHEIENYLLVHHAIARASQVSQSEVEAIVGEVTDAMRDTVLVDMSAMRIEDKEGHPARVGRQVRDELSSRWASLADRLEICPGKETLAAINTVLQRRGHKAVSTSTLARTIRADEVADEVNAVLTEIDELARG